MNSLVQVRLVALWLLSFLGSLSCAHAQLSITTPSGPVLPSANLTGCATCRGSELCPFYFDIDINFSPPLASGDSIVAFVTPHLPDGTSFACAFVQCDRLLGGYSSGTRIQVQVGNSVAGDWHTYYLGQRVDVFVARFSGFGPGGGNCLAPSLVFLEPGYLQQTAATSFFVRAPTVFRYAAGAGAGMRFDLPPRRGTSITATLGSAPSAFIALFAGLPDYQGVPLLPGLNLHLSLSGLAGPLWMGQADAAGQASFSVPIPSSIPFQSLVYLQAVAADSISISTTDALLLGIL